MPDKKEKLREWQTKFEYETAKAASFLYRKVFGCELTFVYTYYLAI